MLLHSLFWKLSYLRASKTGKAKFVNVACAAPEVMAYFFHLLYLLPLSVYCFKQQCYSAVVLLEQAFPNSSSLHRLGCVFYCAFYDKCCEDGR